MNYWGDQVGPVSLASGARGRFIADTALIVLRLEYLAGADNVTMFLNPIPGQPEPFFGTTKSDVDLINTTGLELYSTGAFSFDELRVGETFQSVTPVPEPSAGMLLVFSLMLVSTRKRFV